LLSEKSISLPTKTTIKAIWLSGHSVKGYDPYQSKQTYKWTKFLGRYRNWKVIGKIQLHCRTSCKHFGHGLLTLGFMEFLI